MAAFPAEFFCGEVFKTTFRTRQYKFCPAFPAKLSFITIISLTFRAFHLRYPLEWAPLTLLGFRNLSYSRSQTSERCLGVQGFKKTLESSKIARDSSTALCKSSCGVFEILP